MRIEIAHCDVCGIFTSNKVEPINGKDYCPSCLKNIGLEAWISA